MPPSTVLLAWTVIVDWTGAAPSPSNSILTVLVTCLFICPAWAFNDNSVPTADLLSTSTELKALPTMVAPPIVAVKPLWSNIVNLNWLSDNSVPPEKTLGLKQFLYFQYHQD